MTDPTRHYDALSRDERVRLILAAAGRDDWQEVDRLQMHCQIFEFRGPDPQISQKLTFLTMAGQAVQLWLTEVSHQLCWARLRFSTALEAVLEGGPEARENGNRRRSDEQARKRSEELVESKAMWTGLSRRWKEIERAIQLFCDNTGLDRSWPFLQTELAQMAVGRTPFPDSIIDLARELVDPDASPNQEFVEHVYHALRNHWEYPEMSDHSKGATE